MVKLVKCGIMNLSRSYTNEYPVISMQRSRQLKTETTARFQISPTFMNNQTHVLTYHNNLTE